MKDFTKDFMKNLTKAVEETEFDIKCPSCGKKIKISISQLGKTIKCRYCGQRIKLEK